ncbi:S26 family signal peptidase [Desulfurobacterium sp. TC5-1]|uniref:S26 family signal peptidase n=1 Tax=Desulfurobacterium sp. TC5-1 TaxID=1158318 RepID=UPI0003B7A23E|nr:S26 family signal peptidase [Desulfurobacterium sp. TC5-1]
MGKTDNLYRTGFWILLMFVIFSYLPFRLIVSEDVSLNGKVWIKTPFRPEKGDYVAFPVFKENRYYRLFTDWLLKRDVCDEGERLTVTGGNYFCNGKFLGKAVETDREGRKVSHFVFNGTVPSGYFFAMGTHPRSYDSRYFGFVPKYIAKKVLRVF